MEKESKINDLEMMSELSFLTKLNDNKENLDRYVDEYMESIKRTKDIEKRLVKVKDDNRGIKK